MSQQTEYAISLVHVLLPKNSGVQRVHISVSNGLEIVSTEAHKQIKNGRANYFRETLFLPESPRGLTFTLFDASNGSLRLLKEWDVRPE